jgi:hypothetical protein
MFPFGAPARAQVHEPFQIQSTDITRARESAPSSLGTLEHIQSGNDSFCKTWNIIDEVKIFIPG